MEQAIQIFALVHFAIVGVSHVAAPNAWAQFYRWLRSMDEAGVLILASMRLWYGSLVVAFHPVWSGLPIVLTSFGWSQVVKALVYFCVPRAGLKPLEWLSSGRVSVYAFSGLVLLALTATIAVHLFAGN